MKKFLKMEEIASTYLKKIGNGHLCFGPLVWERREKSTKKHWYFIISGADPAGNYFADQFCIEMPNPEGLRQDLIFAITAGAINANRSLTIHTFEDELDLARMCEIIWPSERTAKIRRHVELERQRVAGSA